VTQYSGAMMVLPSWPRKLNTQAPRVWEEGAGDTLGGTGS
jgi:hypothetical protein